MKQCPKCQNTYTDETLKFCLADGTQLIDLPTDPGKTVEMSGAPVTADDDRTIAVEADRQRIPITPEDSPASVSTVISAPPPVGADAPSDDGKTGRRGVSPLIVGILAVLLIFVLIGFAGLAAYTFLWPGGDSGGAVNGSTENTTPTPADDELSDLRKEIANLREMANRRQENTAAEDDPELPQLPPAEPKNIARVYSPRDGFLALRSEPGTETGYRIMKIPHNATVRILGCRGYSYVGKTRGRWCDVVYTDQRGWVFDAYLRR